MADLTALIQGQWDIPGLLSDLRAQKWHQSEAGRIDRMLWIGSADLVVHFAKQSVSDEEWRGAEAEGFEGEIVDEYMEALAGVVSDAMGKELRREHVYATFEGGEAYLGQYEDIPASELREMGFEIEGAGLGAIELIELGGPQVRTSRYGPLTAQVFREPGREYGGDVYDVTVRDDFGAAFHVDKVHALNHRRAARDVIETLVSHLHDPHAKYHEEALQFGGALEEAMDFIADVRDVEEGASMGAARKKKRIPYRDAMKIARKVERELAPFAEELILVGSLRRKRPEIADIEFVLLPRGWAEGDLEEFTGALEDRGYAIGPKLRKAEKLVNRVKVEVYIAHDPQELGGLVFMYTGDFQWNIAMRRKAKLRGLRLNQYGIWDAEGAAVLQSPDERDFFTFLDVAYHTPEERSVATRSREEKKRRAQAKRGKPRARKKGKPKKRRTRVGVGDPDVFARMENVWREER